MCSFALKLGTFAVKQELCALIAKARAIQQMNGALKLQDLGAQPRNPLRRRFIGHVLVSCG
jgi:hypothetical protein